MPAQLLTAIGEQLEQLVVITAGTGRAPRPWPRPDTALHRLKRHAAEQRHQSLVAEVQQAQQRWAETH